MTSHQKKPLLDLLLSRYPLYTKKELAAFIACRNVIVDHEICANPKELFSPDILISLRFPAYVSRGGIKLAHALDIWDIDVRGLVVLDVGSSTGGFTDCLLQRGAAYVHAVDVGYNQLAYRLRVDKRVIVHERQNIMNVQSLEPESACAVADLSFRSISGAASHILSLTSQKYMVTLIKPQFEVHRGLKDFHGVIADPHLTYEILATLYHRLQTEGVHIGAIIDSPIRGHKGNREFLALLNLQKGLSEEEYLGTLKTMVFS